MRSWGHMSAGVPLRQRIRAPGGTMLQIDPGSGSHRLRFFCPICPYVCAIQSKIVRKARLVKEVEPIFSSEEALKLAAKTEVTCLRCDHGEAYYWQMQTRGADEPTTTYYTCCKCNYNWKED